ncbi:hypothetical protein CAPTEDRAFT_164291 [Capitella teleta]|uniref:Methyltransferase HEMK2 n=1 Tax=Capitella teleta TaxID=283909 RepID=R7TKS1_CAPTE|nr:hypothetical protein CAPTEDRAFT_164291 [Capitella teleta]|eukprot:ELT92146.1 hypothetical protein CAPTEDRAFT_164291 [Capitella teleta]
MHPTPDISHLTSADYEDVYEPAEDSFLFLDALEQEKDKLHALRPSVCLEIGSGSGVVSTFLSSLLSHPAFFICTDINPRANAVTKLTAKKNGMDVEALTTDLCLGLLPRLQGQVDVVLFNPPYVVTPSHEVAQGGIEASWAGGERGREVMDRLFPIIPELLSPKGVFYLIIIKENDSDDISRIFADFGFSMESVLSRRSGPEFLSVLKFFRNKDVS